MTLDFAIRNWSLVVASVLALAIGLFVAHRVFSASARGQLRQQLRVLKQRYRQVDRAQRDVDKAAARLAKLRSKAASVKPRHGREAAEALEDARSLLKIAADQVLIAENHARKVIVEEFPPKRHEALRAKHLRQSGNDGKPFTF